MRNFRLSGFLAALPVPVALLGLSFDVHAQADRPGPAGVAGSSRADENVQAIDDDYHRELIRLDRARLDRLARLAARQKPRDAAVTYERLFRIAIAANLFTDASAAAEAVTKEGSPSPTTTALAHLVRIVALADRGAYEGSLEALRQALADRDKPQAGQPAAPPLSAEEVVGICEAYERRLVQAGQFDVARKAFRLALAQAQHPAVKAFLSDHLRRIEMVGQAAPPIRGTDLDGKPFDLADLRGKVVLVVFWASWCLPNAAEVAWLEQADRAYRDRGLRIVGINLDPLQDGGRKLETVLPNVRRFLLDHNVRWPILVDGAGDAAHARAYGITDIPANVLIDREGMIVQIDLVRKNEEQVLDRVVGR